MAGGGGGGAEKLAYAKLIQNKRGFSVGGRVEAKRGEKRAHAHKVSVPAPLVEKVADEVNEGKKVFLVKKKTGQV